jgi:hypothetical protein
MTAPSIARGRHSPFLTIVRASSPRRRGARA